MATNSELEYPGQVPERSESPEPELTTLEDGEGQTMTLMLFKGTHVPGFPSIKDSIKHRHDFLPRPDDVWVSSFPKSGTHWMNNIVRMILCGVLEDATAREDMTGLEFASPDELVHLASPRVLCTHLAFNDMPREVMKQKSKIIYVSRNPKDIAVSYYYHLTGFAHLNYSGTFNGFYSLYMNWILPRWFTEVPEWINQADSQDNILHVTYENMSRDLPSVVRQISTFLGRPLNIDQCRRIAEKCSFNEMKKKFETPAGLSWKSGAKGLYRKGEVGDWKNMFTVTQNENFDQVFQTHMRGKNVKVEFEL